MSDVTLRRSNWVKLKNRPLFFVHGALKRYDENDFTVMQLDRIAHEMADTGDLVPKIGKSSIEKILNLEPVKHKTAERFVHVLNAAIKDKGSDATLGEERIIAAVFRIPLAETLFDALNVSPHEMATSASVSLPLVENIKRGGRSPLSAALKLRKALGDVAHAKGLDETDQIGSRLFGPLDRLIQDDKESRFDILRDERDVHMIQGSDLEIAPKEGHPWALSNGAME